MQILEYAAVQKYFINSILIIFEFYFKKIHPE